MVVSLLAAIRSNHNNQQLLLFVRSAVAQILPCNLSKSLSTPEFGFKLHFPGIASAREAAAGKDVQPLHHADILMGYYVAVRNKAPNGLRLKMNPKGDRPDRVIVD